MFLIIAGGGRIGYNLLKSQLEKANEVVVIDIDRGRCSCINEEFGNLAVPGDACNPTVIEQAGIARAEMVIACTGKDQDNLVICQIARKKFRVPYTVALVNDPRNEDIFKKLGVDEAVSSIDVVLNQIEQKIAHHGSMTIIAREDDIEVIETRLPQGSPAVGKTISQIPFPSRCLVSSIIREGELMPATPDTELEAGDIIFTFSPSREFANLKADLLGFDMPVQDVKYI